MIKNYFKISLRALRRHPSYAGINIAGLAVGMACFMLIALYVQDERQFDSFHDNANRIVRITSHRSEEGNTRSFARSNPAIGPTLLQDLSEVENTVRFQAYSGSFRHQNLTFSETEVFFVEASVFDIFTFPLLQGNPRTALLSPNTAVLTETTAKRYFGDENALGEVIVMSDTLNFTVTGVAGDIPAQSHLNFDILLSFSTYKSLQAARGRDLDNLWSSGTFYTYALLTSPDAFASTEEQLSAYLERQIGQQTAGMEYSLGLQPLRDIHLRSNLRQELGPNGSLTYNYVFSIIAIFILLISCVNFMNLATARSTRRAREVGVRKSLGALRAQLMRQFLSESVLLSFASLLLALAVVVLVLPVFNDFAGKSLTFEWARHWAYLPLSLGLALIVGLLAGSYPALLLSAFLPVKALKGAISSGQKGTAIVLRRGLVVFQFTLSIAIISGTVIAVQQLDHMRGQSLGFDQEQIAVIPFSWDSVVQDRYETLKDRFLESAAIEQVTASGDVPGRMFTSMGYWIEGMPDEEYGGINALIVEADFAETYGLEMISGRDFSVDQAANLGESFVLNEAAVAEIGMTPQEIIGKRFQMNSTGPVIGVVKDFHFAGLQNTLEPLVMTVWPSWWGYISLRINSADMAGTLASVAQTWKQVIPNRPFEVFFLDDDFQRLYQAESRFGRLFVIFAVLAIFISCLGLFGLAVFTAEQRTKEIGVRKVMGASVSSIVLLLNRDMTLLVLASSVLAAPIAYFAMHQWLDTFAYRIDISLAVFILAGVGAMAVMWMTVAYQSAKAALTDPIKAIRYE